MTRAHLLRIAALAALGLAGCDPESPNLASEALALSHVEVSGITETSATIDWSTNLSATSIIEYGVSAAYGESTPLYGLTLNHAVQLEGLTPATVYHFRITSQTSDGGTASSSDMSFTTLGGGTDSGLNDAGRADAGSGDGGGQDAGPVLCPSGSVPVSAADDLQAMVSAADAGSTFCLLADGVHHDSVMQLKDGDIFTSPSGTTAEGVTENGSKRMTGWTQVTLNGVSYWTTAGGTPLVPNPFDSRAPVGPFDTLGDSFCVAPYLACFYPQGLYVNSTPYTQWPTLGAVQPGSWYYEVDAMQSARVANAGSGYAVGDVLTVSGGTLGTVAVTSVGASGNVTGVQIVAPGYAFSPSATEATSGGTGSGCTLAVTAGSGGVRNNIYLSASEQPNAQTVELGTLRFLFQSDTAQNITIRGLVVEKYASGLNGGPVSVTHGGCTGCAASGWLIENNELRLNQDVGVKLNYGTGKVDQVLGNDIHDNGQFGVGGGDNGVPFLISGNHIHNNNRAHVNTGYGSGGLKLGSTHGDVTVSYNVVHDDDGCGLWSDVDCQGVTYDHNTVYNEPYDGIRLEISNHQTVTHNTVYNCGSAGSGSSQINYANSSGGVIMYNQLTTSGRAPGISVHHNSQRDHSHPDFNVPAGMNVSQNVIQLLDGGQGSVMWEADAGLESWELTGLYDDNTYCVPSLPWNANDWGVKLENVMGSFAQWQDAGQDLHGQLVTGACPAVP
jgi:parallel beta-helix repeat protein